jgi:organic radical activating enzyme
MMMQRANLCEIFDSIQGEGPYAGVRQVFVRFFECNMHCTWCDTPASIGDTTRNFETLALDDVMAQMEKRWQSMHSVSLTGGEPLLQAEFISSLLDRMASRKMPAYLETNGTLPDALAKVIDRVAIVAMDIKLPSSTKAGVFWREHEEFLKIALQQETFVKAVVTSDTAVSDVEEMIALLSRVAPEIPVILQPNTYQLNNGVMPRCVEFHQLCLRHLKDVRVMPQMHKFMKIR